MTACLVAAWPIRFPALCAAVPSLLVAFDATIPMLEGILETGHSYKILVQDQFKVYFVISSTNVYRGTHLLANFTSVDFDLVCSTILPTCSVLPISHQTRQNQFKVNPSEVRQEMDLPVHRSQKTLILFHIDYLEMAFPILEVAFTVASFAADPTLNTALAVFLVPNPILEATLGSVSNQLLNNLLSKL